MVTHRNNKRRDEPPTDPEEHRWREAQHHLHILKVVPVACERKNTLNTAAPSAHQRVNVRKLRWPTYRKHTWCRCTWCRRWRRVRSWQRSYPSAAASRFPPATTRGQHNMRHCTGHSLVFSGVCSAHLCGQGHTQEKAQDGHSKCDDGFVPDDPVRADLVHYGCHQRLQKTELPKHTHPEVRECCTL